MTRCHPFRDSLTAIVLTCGLAAGASAATIVHEAPQTAPKGQVAAGDLLGDFEPIGPVEDLYDRFAAISRASGQDVQFELSGATTYRPQQFDEVLWLELFTEPGGWTLETVPHELIAELPSRNVVSFVSEWKDVDASSWNEQEFLKSASLLRASDAAEQLADWDGARFGTLAGLTSYEVSVSFDDRSRSYRGLAVWTALPGDTLLLTVVDHVVPEVSSVHQVTQAKAVPVDDFFTRANREAGTDPDNIDAPQCPTNTFDQIDPTISTPGFTIGHSSGQHNASLRPARTCRQSSCQSFCTPYSAFQACREFGSISNILYWHKTSTTIKLSSRNGIGLQVSECGIGWGCAVKACLIGICGSASFGVSGSGASLTVTATSAVLTDMSISSGGFCPAGELDIPSCIGSVGEVVSLSLDDGSVTHDLPATDFKLLRNEPSDVMHHGQEISYVLGEWALLSYQAPHGKSAAAVSTVSTSSPDFASAKQTELETALAGGLAAKAAPGEHLSLVVGLPLHEANSRKIAMPELKVGSDRVPAGSGDRTILVRADFAEDHTLQGLDFLHDSRGGVPHDLAVHIEKSLSLESATDEQHRVIAFVLLSVGDTLELESVIPYLPKCCCGPYFC